MNIVVCSISFRYELVSFLDLVHFADQYGFAGIELWGVHGRALLQSHSGEVSSYMDHLGSKGLYISMVSEYIDLLMENESMLISKWNEIAALAQKFRTNRIRIFAGNQPSSSATDQDWQKCVTRLRQLAALASKDDIFVVVETHPNTYADTLQSTLRLVHDVQHAHLKINLDVLHLWESGSDPICALKSLEFCTVNYHMKNISQVELTHIFEPANVFSPSGNRKEMRHLSNGAIEYEDVFKYLQNAATQHPIALEWFGNQPAEYLVKERAWFSQYL